MVLLGIDPGFKHAGFGILALQDKRVMVIDCGCLNLPQAKSLQERIGIFHTFFTEKIITYNITHIALETPFLGKNTQSFLKLGYLRGIIYLLSNVHALELYEFAPRQVKQAVTGFGGASKEQVALVIGRLFPKLPVQSRLDITDALAITLCGVWSTQNKIRL